HRGSGPRGRAGTVPRRYDDELRLHRGSGAARHRHGRWTVKPTWRRHRRVQWDDRGIISRDFPVSVALCGFSAVAREGQTAIGKGKSASPGRGEARALKKPNGGGGRGFRLVLNDGTTALP